MKNCSLAKGPFKKSSRRCDWCGGPLKGKRTRWCRDACSKSYYENHLYRMARKACRRRDKYRCIKCGSKDRLEVNHIIPCLGNHSKQGCWHHLSNLELLCHECHSIATKIQKEDGKFIKRTDK